MNNAQQNIENIRRLIQAKNKRAYLPPEMAFSMCPNLGKGLRRKDFLIRGDTLPVRMALAAMGCKWSRVRGAWAAPSNSTLEAKAIIKAHQLAVLDRTESPA